MDGNASALCSEEFHLGIVYNNQVVSDIYSAGCEEIKEGLIVDLKVAHSDGERLEKKKRKRISSTPFIVHERVMMNWYLLWLLLDFGEDFLDRSRYCSSRFVVAFPSRHSKCLASTCLPIHQQATVVSLGDAAEAKASK